MPSFFYMEADTVVAQALRATRRNRSMYVNGALNRAMTGTQRVAPRWLVAKIAGMLYRPQ